MNPYSENTFFEFFITLFLRLWGAISGAEQTLSSDELQLLTLSLIAISCSSVGVFLWLKKITMMANALSHTVLVGIVASFLITSTFLHHEEALSFSTTLSNEWLLLGGALIAAFVTVFTTHFLIHKIQVHEDESIGMVFTFLFAVGVLLVTLFSKNVHIGAELLMGNADALSARDLAFQWKVTLFDVGAILLLYRPLAVSCQDALFAKCIGFRPTLVGYVLMGLMAIASLAAFRAVGVMLVLSFFVLPAVTARLFTYKLKILLPLAIGLSCMAAIVGVALSRHLITFGYALSTSSVIATLMFALYMVGILLRRRA